MAYKRRVAAVSTRMQFFWVLPSPLNLKRAASSFLLNTTGSDGLTRNQALQGLCNAVLLRSCTEQCGTLELIHRLQNPQ